MAGILVSFRRDDSRLAAARLADELGELLGADRVFLDIEIPPDSDFTDLLHRAVAAGDALLVVIGRAWAAFSDHGHGPRLFEPTDWVRTQIEAAFAQGKPVIPVLVGGAQMPAADGLPQSIARLTRLQAAELGNDHWDTGLEDLADRLRRLCPVLADETPWVHGAQESPAEVLYELDERLLDEAASRRRPHIEPPRLPPTTLQRLLAMTARSLKWLVWLVLLIGLVYAGLRLFGDESILNDLRVFETWLQGGWESLEGWLARA